MTAQSAAQPRTTRSGETLNIGVKQTSQIYAGGIVLALAGVAIAGRVAASRTELVSMRALGIALADVLGGASDGLEKIDVRPMVGLFANSASGDLITDADIGSPAFLVDDQTVAKTIGGGVRPIAGEIVDVDADGVWVAVGRNAGLRRVRLPFTIPATELAAGTAIELISPVAGAIIGAKAIVQTAIVTGGDITLAVGVTAVTGLALTVADAAAKGAVVSDEPTAGHASTVVAEGDRIQVVPAAAFNGGGAVSGYVEIAH